MLNKSLIYDFIETHKDQHLTKIQELIRQQSVSPTGEGIEQCAELMQRYFLDLGCDVSELVETKGYPVVYANLDVGAKNTVLVYSQYDTQPADEPDWICPPFEGRITEVPDIGKCLIGRGAYNTKGPTRIFLNACEAIQKSGERMPVNLIFVSEGEEEVGSRHLPDFISSYKEKLGHANFFFSAQACQNTSGEVMLYLGVKGIVPFELSVDGAEWGKGPTEFNLHGGNKSWVDSPVWRLVKALSSLVDESGNIAQIPGFYEKVRKTNASDLELIKKLAGQIDLNKMKEELKIKRFVNDSEAEKALELYCLAPALNIDGIESGYNGEEMKAILPRVARAKLDVRLVPDMELEEIQTSIKKHLLTKGFPEVIVTFKRGYPWAKTELENPEAQALLKSYREFGHDPQIWPSHYTSAPYSLFNRASLFLPFIVGGLGHASKAHASNEYLVIDGGKKFADVVTSEKFFVSLLENFGRIQSPDLIHKSNLKNVA